MLEAKNHHTRYMMTIYNKVVRTIVDLPEDKLRELSELGKREGVSRAELIRRAVAEYLERQTASEMANAFGLWKDEPVDGLDYEERLRSEWS